MDDPPVPVLAAVDMRDAHGPGLGPAVGEDLVEALVAHRVRHLPVGAHLGDLDVVPEARVRHAAEALAHPPEDALQLIPAGLVGAPRAEQAHGVAPGPQCQAWRDVPLDRRRLRLRQSRQRAFRVAQRLSGLAEDEVDELVTELGEDPSVGSGSD